MAITPLPTPVPNSTMSEGVFDEAADNFLGALPDFATEANALAADVNAKASTATGAASTATTKAGEAADSASASATSANSAAATAGADAHVPNAAYTSSSPASAVVSNVDGQTYRCIVSHSGVATDPANDPTRWVRISFSGDYGDLNGGPAIASEGQAEAGTNNTALMTPLRTAQAIAALAPSLSTDSTSGANQTVDFSGDKVHVSTADTATVTYTFSGAIDVAKVDLVIDFVPVETYVLSAAVYDGVSLPVGIQDYNPSGITFSTDGMKMFMVGSGNDNVHQYSLSSAFNIATASYDNVSYPPKIGH